MLHARPFVTTLRLFLPLVVVAAVAAAVLALVAGGTWWALRSEGGTRWVLEHLPGVEVEGWHGALAGDRLGADRLRVQWAGGRASVTITGLEAEGLVWTREPAPGRWFGLDVARLAARRIVVDPGPPSGDAPVVPRTLALPLRLRLAGVEVGELAVGTTLTLRRLSGALALGDGDRHRADGVRFEWDRLAVQADAAIDSTPPFALAGTARAQPADASFDARLRAAGALERIEVDGQLQGQAARGHAAPAAGVHAVLVPFASWPLAELSARTEALDLAALSSRAPQTRLSGRVDVKTSARDAPIGASAELQNTLPGRWNEGRLPVARLQLELQTAPAQRERIELKAFDLQLADAKSGAGRVRGSGHWVGHDLELDAALTELRPQRLDERAAAMQLSGPLAVRLHGLPSPAPGGAAPPPWSLELRSTLDGRLDAAPQPVTLTLEAHADATQVDLRQLRAQSGAAVAQVRAGVRRLATGGWQVETSGSLAEFDPLPWWPGEPGSAWRQGSHRFNGAWQLAAQVPAGADRMPPLTLASRLAGNGTLRLQESVLAGVPLALDLALSQVPGRGSAPSRLAGEVHLGQNTIAVEGEGNPTGDGTADRLDLRLDAPALAALAPLVRLDRSSAAWAPRGGTLTASVRASGRWPQIRTEGEAEGRALAAGDATLEHASARWHLDFDAGGRQPLEMKAELTGARLGTQRAQLLRAELRGTPREHQLRLDAALPITPPAGAEQVLGLRAQAGTRVEVAGSGAWEPEAAGGGRWRGRVTRFAAGAWDGKALGGEAPGQWADARDLAAELQFDERSRLVRVQADAGRLKLADTFALRWDRIDADLRGALPMLTLRAEIDPFALAPLLARLQPGIGWRGDLRLAASIDVRAAERFDADIVFERRDGDLQIKDEGGTQSLGLTDLRIALAAHDGTWFFTQALAGRSLGEMAGAVSVRTTPERRWPGADAPLDGVLQARVASLGIWGAWVPPGWRLAGELRTSATIGGRFGAPEYTGQIEGHEIGVRNLLQGVNITGGEVMVRLQGERARIERFTLKGGDGTLAVSGSAEFGSAPSARLQLAAERFRLLGRIDRQLTTSGQAVLDLTAEQVKLDGRFTIDDGLFDTSRRDAPGLDDDVTVKRAADVEKAEEAAAAPRARRDVAVAVDVDLGQNLRVRGRGLDTSLRGLLRITTPGGRLAINGTVSTADGTYAAYGQKLDIERGILAFSGAVDNPRLDILALRPNTDMRVGLQITGTAQSPRARLYAETDMSETDKLSWLVLGRAPDGLGRTDMLLLQRAAVAVLAGEEEAPTDQIIRTLGLDEVSLKQTDGEVRETVVSLGKQLSRRWYLGYERGVNATTGTWQLIYRIAQRFTLRAQSGLENSLDLIWTWKFDEVPLPAAMRNSPADPP